MLHQSFRALGFALKSGEPLIPALKRQKGKFKKAAKYVEAEDTLTESIKKAGINRLALAILRTGEYTGKLESTFDQLADFFEARYRYQSHLFFSLLKAFIIIGAIFGIIGFYMQTLEIPLPHFVLTIGLAAPSALLSVFFLLLLLMPGFNGWSRAVTLKFGIAAGLSFTEMKRIFAESGLSVNLRAEDIAGLFPLPKEQKKLIVNGQETGELDQSLLLVEREMQRKLNSSLESIERLFYYTSIAVALGIFLACVLLLAGKGLSEFLLKLQ